MRFFSAVAFALLSHLSVSQSHQQAYLQAKSFFKQSQYDSAIAGFSQLTTNEVFGPYATFYLGLSYHKNENHTRAIDAFRQLRFKFPDFDQVTEVQYWLSDALFADNKFNTAVSEVQILPDKIRRYFYQNYLQSRSFIFIKNIQAKYPDDKELAKILIKKGGLQQSIEKSFLDSLRRSHGLKREDVGAFPTILKDEYAIGVFLPFLLNGSEISPSTVRDNFVMDLYQGMVLAGQMLKEKGFNIKLYPFDTRKDSLVTKTLLKDTELKDLDLIIGPIYPQPVAVVKTYCQKNDVTMLNPLSSSGRVVKGCDMAYLLKPSYETMAAKAAAFIADKPIGTRSRIYYEDKYPEKQMAQVFREHIEEAGFEVSVFEKITSESARKVHSTFSNQKRKYLYLNRRKAKELREKGRNIKERRKYDDDGNPEYNADGSPKMVYYEMVSGIDADSLDHMFVMTKSNHFANNFIGAAESSAVRVLGMSDWLDFTMLSYDQLERLAITLLHPGFFNRETEFFQRVTDRFKQQLNEQPSEFHLLGFESVWWSGHMMNKYGKYMQNGFYDEPDFPFLMFGHQYEGSNDNQAAPLVRFKDHKLKAVNFSDESTNE